MDGAGDSGEDFLGGGFCWVFESDHVHIRGHAREKNGE